MMFTFKKRDRTIWRTKIAWLPVRLTSFEDPTYVWLQKVEYRDIYIGGPCGIPGSWEREYRRML